MRLIDADKLESSELIIPTLYGGYEYVEVFFKEDVDDAPTVDAIKHGRWDNMGDFEQCSVCHGTHLKEIQTYYGKATWIKMSYCPHCGAKMDEVEE